MKDMNACHFGVRTPLVSHNWMFREVAFTLAILKKNQVSSLLRSTPEIIFLRIILDASSVHTD